MSAAASIRTTNCVEDILTPIKPATVNPGVAKSHILPRMADTGYSYVRVQILQSQHSIGPPSREAVLRIRSSARVALLILVLDRQTSVHVSNDPAPRTWPTLPHTHQFIGEVPCASFEFGPYSRLL